MVKHVDSVELRVVAAAVLAVAADAVLAVSICCPGPFWLPHWPARTCIISREEKARVREAHGRKKAGNSGETQETSCGSLSRETENASGARAYFQNWGMK
jgi:hypothetical protein